MATNANVEFNKLLKFKKRMAGISEDIRFLRTCLKHGVTPKSHEVKIKVSIHGFQKQKNDMERVLIRTSIRYLYSRLNKSTLNAYNAHLSLAKEVGNRDDLHETIGKIQTGYTCEKLRKRRILTKKLKWLIGKTTQERRRNIPEAQPKMENIPEFVTNKSSAEFTTSQMDILNKGLNYAVRMPHPPIEEIIADVEAAIKFSKEDEKAYIRRETTKIIETAKNTTKRRNKGEIQIINELKKKPVYYLKADKGNRIVIMDKEEYDRQVVNKIQHGKYKELRVNPLPDSIKRVDRAIRECTKVIGNENTKIKVPNPVLPRLRCLPKIHKAGDEMREIIAATNSPTTKLAAWLLEKFKGLGEVSSRSVSNYKEVIKKIQRAGKIDKDEILVSFDIKALYPSIPVRETMKLLEDWLTKQKEESGWKYQVKEYVRLAWICVNENHFTFRGKFYKSTDGLAMGNPLSGFLSEIFLDKMEADLETEGLLPRLWMRYVDDVFAICDKEEAEATLMELNSRHGNIKFTMEVENEGRLPFLDLIIKRNDESLCFEIYRKPTHTQRLIPSCSNHHIGQKMAAFNSMIHRLINVPMSDLDFAKEKEYILDTGRKNGYKTEVIAARIRKIQERTRQHQLSTLFSEDATRQPPKKRFSLTYENHISRAMRKAFGKIGMDAADSSRIFQVKTLIGSVKDKKTIGEKSGIYCIKCPECGKKYIGQTRRIITTRFNEHISESRVAKKTGRGGRHFSSAVAKHICDEGHNIGIEDITVIKEIGERRKLDFYESLTIHREDEDNLMNEEKGGGDTPLFRLLN